MVLSHANLKSFSPYVFFLTLAMTQFTPGVIVLVSYHASHSYGGHRGHHKIIMIVIGIAVVLVVTDHFPLGPLGPRP